MTFFLYPDAFWFVGWNFPCVLTCPPANFSAFPTMKDPEAPNFFSERCPGAYKPIM